MAPSITHLFNHIICTGTYPKKLKISRIIPIKKAGKNKDSIDSYRPISNLHPVDKIIETIMKDQMDRFIQDNDIIPDQIHGSRPHHLVITAKYEIEL